MTGIELRPRAIVVNELATGTSSTKKGIKAVTDFGNVFLDAIEKKDAGLYTNSDKEQLSAVYKRAVENVDDPDRFTEYFGRICKTYGYL